MGGTWVEWRVRRVRDDAAPPAEALRRFWDAIDAVVRSTVTGEAGDQVLALYLGMVAADGQADGSWYAGADRFTASFGDMAGLCGMSSQAAVHWAVVVPATDSAPAEALEDAGWALAGPAPSRARALLEPRPALVELRDTLYAVPRLRPGARLDEDTLWTDDGLPRSAPADWTADERVAVEAAVLAGDCGCEYCRNVLPFVLPSAWLEGPREDLAPAWEALAALPAEEAAAREALRGFDDAAWAAAPAGPPALDAVRDALAARGLRPPLASLARMVVRRGSE